MKLSIAYEFLPKQKTVRTSQVMKTFGIDFEQGHHILADQVELPLEDGQIVIFTGDSGSGKSSLMRASAQQLSEVLELNALSFPEASLVDGLNLEVQDGLQILAACGLGEAHLMLRRPEELSDGQKYRYRLALAIAQHPTWILADEFTATLDRVLAKVIAFNLRKLCNRLGIGFLIATTHQDILTDLSPDIHVQCCLGSDPIVITRDRTENSVKKNPSALRANSGSVLRPVATGRTSLDGIIAPIISAS